MNNQDVINEIRSKVDIVDVISEYLPLTKKGKNYFGVCPFHDDNNPSMSVSREKQIFRCFSCGASGNVFTFVQDYEQIDFKDALKLLADKSGVTINTNGYQKSNKYDKLYSAYDITNRFYQNNLKSSVGKIALKYLEDRNINNDVINYFGIGLSSVNSDVTKLLIKKEYDIKTLNDIGISYRDSDIYIDRIMFPLCDTRGNVVAFSGRRYKDENGSKYINTKETVIFKKGDNLYNYHRAREEVRIKKEVIVVEGFMDVIRLHTAGIKNVVALMGTAMTKEQANLIKKLSDNVILMFDGDEAGLHADMVNGEVLDKMVTNLKIVPLEDNLDPDEYILKYGFDAIKTRINDAIYYKDFKIKQLKNNRNLNSNEDKANYIDEVLKETSGIKDEIRREIILKSLANEFNLEYNTLEKRLSSYMDLGKKDDISKIEIVTKPKLNRKDKYYMAPRYVIYSMINKPDVIDYYDKHGIFFYEDKFKILANEISYYYRKYSKISEADFYTYLSDKEDLLSLFKDIMSSVDFDDISDLVIKDNIKVLEDYTKNQEIKRLKEMLKNTSDFNKKLELSEKIARIKIGSEINGERN